MITVVSRWAAWPLLAAVVFVTLSPISFRPVTGGPVDIERFIAFAVLGAVFCLAYPKHRVLVLVFLVAVAGALEVLQHLIPTRHGRLSDAAVKVLGAATGVILAGKLAAWCPNLFRRDL